MTRKTGAALIWIALALAAGLPLIVAAKSPLLAWRDPIYIMAGFAGIIAMICLLIQPLLITGLLPGLTGPRARRLHRFIGATLVLLVILHVAGLWITSPPDVIDALLFASPTPFSDWGVIAMWAVFAAALFAAFRHRLGLAPRTWRRIHTTLTPIIVICSVLHAMLIDGTMGTLSKAVLCSLVVVATLKVLRGLKVWSVWWPRR